MESKFASSSSIVFIVIVFFFLCSTRTTISIQTNIIFNATVAQDGSGNYRHINDAIAAPMHINSLTIENSTPINSHQAVALYNNADHSTFYKCIFMGYQDTLLANKNSQIFKNCEILATCDFIFGFASAVFQDCGIYIR
ncbi:hypothetical protein HYC85_022477 [Camellia sinensis]|uniref:Pectinesterase catalytic domain-containing protein n=1 Tax=Camellia sinensis TaxID=4442 RepID=A0A7J7GKW6_CAMSI|nr:hypothetical protein HYC85_022477 [Camellia sinensis]